MAMYQINWKASSDKYKELIVDTIHNVNKAIDLSHDNFVLCLMKFATLQPEIKEECANIEENIKMFILGED
jgi:hypothetical protein